MIKSWITIKYWNQINRGWFANSAKSIIQKKVFKDFKNKQKKCMKYFFWYVKVSIFWKCIQSTIHWDKTQMLKKFLLTK